MEWYLDTKRGSSSKPPILVFPQGRSWNWVTLPVTTDEAIRANYQNARW